MRTSHSNRQFTMKPARGAWAGQSRWLAVVFVVMAAPSTEAQPVDGVPYAVSFTGVEDRALLELVRGACETVSRQDRLPASMALLRRRAGNDLPRILGVLHSSGYYGARADLAIESESRPVRILFTIALGPIYRIQSIDVAWEGPEPEGHAARASNAVTLRAGDAALARPIIDDGNAVVAYLRRFGYPFPMLSERDVIVDHASESAAVTYRVLTGPKAGFGDVHIEGLEKVDPSVIRKRLPWREGDPFSSDQMNEARRMLAELGLFSTFSVTAGAAVDEHGALPIRIHVEEAKHRTIAGGLSAETDSGLGVFASWEHRNFTRRGDRFNVEAKASGLSTTLRLAYARPHFRRTDQGLALLLEAGEERPDAYTSRLVRTEAHIERRLSPVLKVSVGAGLKTARVEQRRETTDYVLFYLPLEGQADLRDDPVDPTSGGVFTLNFTPYLGTGDIDPLFSRITASYSHFVSVSERTVLAGRLTLGSLIGATSSGIPPDERFYTGGGSSVRGYSFATLSPLVDNKPVGGKSLAEISIEARHKIRESIGLVLFVDGGGAFDHIYPDFGEDLRWGAGAGVRFYTPAGPFRIDLAVPVNRRKGLDDAFQIYASFGHTF